MRCEMATNILKHLGALQFVCECECERAIIRDAMGIFLRGKSIDAAFYRFVHTFRSRFDIGEQKKKKTEQKESLCQMKSFQIVCRFVALRRRTPGPMKMLLFHECNYIDWCTLTLLLLSIIN